MLEGFKKQVFVFAIGFAATAAQKISIYSTLEISLGNGKQYLRKGRGRSGSFVEVKYLKRKKVGRLGFRATFFE